MHGYTRAAQGISFDSMKEHQQEVNKILMDDPNRKGFFSSRRVRWAAAAIPDSSSCTSRTASERPKIPSPR